MVRPRIANPYYAGSSPVTHSKFCPAGAIGRRNSLKRSEVPVRVGGRVPKYILASLPKCSDKKYKVYYNRYIASNNACKSFRIGTAIFIYYGLLDTVVVGGAECLKTPSIEANY